MPLHRPPLRPNSTHPKHPLNVCTQTLPRPHPPKPRQTNNNGLRPLLFLPGGEAEPSFWRLLRTFGQCQRFLTGELERERLIWPLGQSTPLPVQPPRPPCPHSPKPPRILTKRNSNTTDKDKNSRTILDARRIAWSALEVLAPPLFLRAPML